MTSPRTATPALRFPQFAGPWMPKKGGEAFTQRRERGEEGLPLYSVTIDRGMVLRDSLDREISSAMDDKGNLRVRKDDLAYNMMRMWQGAVGRAPEDGMVSPAYVVLAPKDGTIPAFFEQWFKRPRSLYLLWAYSYGLTNDRLRLYFRDFAKVPMTLPSSDEQKKIADFLVALDTRIALLTRKVEVTARYKREIARRLFERELRFYRDDGLAFPEWQPFALGAVLDWKPTNSLSRERLIWRPGELWKPGEVQNIHYGDIHTKFPVGFRQSEQSVPCIADARDIVGIKPAAFCEVGDLVIADASEDYSDIGKTIEILEAAPRSLVAGLHTLLARPKRGMLALGFGGYLFQSPGLRRQIMRAAQGISVLGISKRQIEKIRVDLPHVDEQRCIADFLSALDDRIAALRAKVAALQSFKKGLLHQMFV